MNIYANKSSKVKFKLILIALLSALILQSATHKALASEHEGSYEDDLAKVSNTQSLADDIKLLDEMLYKAQSNVIESPNTSKYICKQAIKYCSSKKEFLKQLGIAYEILLSAPKVRNRQSVLEKFIKVQSKIYKLAKKVDKPLAASPLIEAYIELSDFQIKALDKSKAKASLRKAFKLARSCKSRLQEKIKNHSTSTATKIEAQTKARKLKSKLMRNPKDHELRKQLVEMYIIDADDIDSAELLLTPDLDEQTRAYVFLARKPVNSLSAQSAHELASWYRRLDSRSKSKTNFFSKHKEYLYLSQFIRLYHKFDSKKDKALNRIEKLKKTLKKNGYSFKEPSWSEDPIPLGITIPKENHKAIKKAITFLCSRQRNSGAWVNRKGKADPMTTAAVVYALLKSGLDIKDRKIPKALAYLAEQKKKNSHKTGRRYDSTQISWRLLAFSAAHERGYPVANLMRSDAKLLLSLSKNTCYHTYVTDENINSSGSTIPTFLAQFALAHASKAGYTVPRKFWTLAAKTWKAKQNKDGGWGMITGNMSQSYYTTAAGTMFAIANDKIFKKQKTVLKTKTIKKAISFLNSKKALTPNAKSNYHYISMWFITKFGVATKNTEFMNKNWYETFSTNLLKIQSKTNGSFSRPANNFRTALGILILLAPQPDLN